MTRCLRGIHAAWHFGYAVNFGGESGLRRLGLGGTHPLTQRYVDNVRTLCAHTSWILKIYIVESMIKYDSYLIISNIAYALS
ncbi:DUF3265 domain-containing protein [Vibrio vulnificus]|nr:DUF3265 domain-containing protein [Vibrio vulnificus]